MEYLLCSGSAYDAENSASSSTPSLAESSSSEPSGEFKLEGELRDDQVYPSSLPKAGFTSPSAICGPRKLSTAIASSPNSQHPALAGRPTMVLPKQTMPTMDYQPESPARARPPRTPRSAPQRPNWLNPGKCQKGSSVAPLPQGPEEDVIVKPALHRSQSAPAEADPSRQFRCQPAPLRLEAWSEPAAEVFNVRGPTYLRDRVKQSSEAAAFRLLTVDLVQSDEPLYGGLCAHPEERFQRALERERETGSTELPPFVFAINLCVPGCNKTYHQVSYFAVDDLEELEHPTTPFGRLMNKFVFGDSDEFRNKTFKLIPRIVDGNFVVRKTVGSKPSILGKKIKQYYVRGPRHFEVIVDIASDAMAQRIVKLVLGYTKSMVVDMMFLLEAKEEETLPERVFGGVRMKNIDFKGRDGKRLVRNCK